MALTVTEYGPGDNGLASASNMKAAANTQYETSAIDVRGMVACSVAVTVDNTGGGAAGTAKVYAVPCALDGTEIGPNVDLATAINTKVDGKGWVGISQSAAKASGATVDASAPAILSASKLKFGLEVTEQSDATTCVASMYVTVVAEGK